MDPFTFRSEERPSTGSTPKNGYRRSQLEERRWWRA
ncbi:hypothetical protein E1A91_A08G197000v1 [Gossypium mustelinum]|uniref:Uncharacterized protein n=1 Tax=Gossypium mustelinum TaxID=34275 RepID=A0A5D2YCD3_GOSMU|nr:hypothetical protein E1A91_A08G197000v1 [Gossypium mustelinum]